MIPCRSILGNTLLLGALSVPCGAGGVIDRDALVQDVRQLSEILETSHPDPYIRGGGKIAYHRRLHGLLGALPAEGMTRDAFQMLLRPFVAAVGDGHTRLHVDSAEDPKHPGGIPLELSVVGKSLYVSGVADERDERLLGSGLVSVEGVPFSDLCRRASTVRGTDNAYGALSLLAGRGRLWYRSGLEELVPEWSDRQAIVLGLRDPNGGELQVRLRIPAEIGAPLIGAPSQVVLPDTTKSELAYSFLDKAGRVALLRVVGMGGFRENFELVGLDQELHLNGARFFYQRYNGQLPPDDKSRLMAGIPSATETFRLLVSEMKQRSTELLVIDLRDNGGGNSTLAHFLCFFLYGKEKLLDYGLRGSGYEVTKYSDLFFEQNPGSEKPGEGLPFSLGTNDYWFEESYRPRTAEQVRQGLGALYARMPSFARYYTGEEYSALYAPPRVVVLCSPRTYSSGYTMMKALAFMGAKTLGTPSSQAENAPGWALNYRLRNTGITGSVACKYYASSSSRVVDGVFQLDHSLTYDLLRGFGFDPNSEVLLALQIYDPGGAAVTATPPDAQPRIGVGRTDAGRSAE